jgi:hypothetical protein
MNIPLHIQSQSKISQIQANLGKSRNFTTNNTKSQVFFHDQSVIQMSESNLFIQN